MDRTFFLQHGDRPKRSKSLIGKVLPNSIVEPFDGFWRSGEQCSLKTLVVQNAEWVNREDCLVLGVGRPRQGTIFRWWAVGHGIAARIEGRERPITWDTLPPACQEIACSEMLRLPEAEQLGLPRLRCLLLPVGGNMRDIDIVGLSFRACQEKSVAVDAGMV